MRRISIIAGAALALGAAAALSSPGPSVLEPRPTRLARPLWMDEEDRLMRRKRRGKTVGQGKAAALRERMRGVGRL
jgi:hypothetical protein